MVYHTALQYRGVEQSRARYSIVTPPTVGRVAKGGRSIVHIGATPKSRLYVPVSRDGKIESVTALTPLTDNLVSGVSHTAAVRMITSLLSCYP